MLWPSEVQPRKVSLNFFSQKAGTNRPFQFQKRVSFSAARNALRRRDVRLQSRSFAHWNQSLRHSHNSIQSQLRTHCQFLRKTSLRKRIVDKQQRAVQSSSLLLHKIELEFVLIVTQDMASLAWAALSAALFSNAIYLRTNELRRSQW